MAMGAILAAAAFCMADILRFCYVLIKGGFFYLLTSGLFFTAAAVYDSKNAQPKLQSTPKLIWTLIGANVAVFLLWHVPALVPAMFDYFTFGVASENFWLSMFLSMFSHFRFLHLLANMLELENFAVDAIGLLGPAQFMAMYLSGGLFSALFLMCYNALIVSEIPALGASGAISAVVGYVCAKLPDQLVHFSFLPMFQLLFYRFRTNSLFFTTAAVYDYKNAQPKLQSTRNWIWTLIGAVAVFLLWHVTALVPAMSRYFTSGVASDILSGVVIGVIFRLFSLCHEVSIAEENPSLGASGAICSGVGYVCAKLQGLLMYFIFLPIFPFSANSFLYGSLALETFCLLRILPFHTSVGHAAHIGGFLFGMYYAHYGEPHYRHVVNWLRGNVGALPTTTSSSTMMIVNSRNKREEEDTNNDRELLTEDEYRVQ
uniref:rhomboid protease n=1 Tax=Globodera pallida TaxID=36090 RepID=A0A183CF19_GLOPA